MNTRSQILAQIARDYLQIQTLQQRHCDSLDFYDVGVVGIRQALDAAYRAGQAELLAAAEALLVAKDQQMETADQWRGLRKAVRHAKKHRALPKP